MRTVPRLTIGLATLMLAARASAQPLPADPAGGEMKQPVAYAERPLTLPAMTLSPELNVQIIHVDLGGLGSGTGAGIEVGASFGILDDLMVDARPLGFITGEGGTAYSRFQIGVTYRFLEGPVEIGVQFRSQIDNDRAFAFNPGLPVRIHAGHIVRIDTGLNFNLVVPTAENDKPLAQLAGVQTDVLRAAEIGVPFDIAFQIVPQMFLGLTTGFGMGNFNNPINSILMPLSFFAGGTVPGDQGPLVDIGASFGFPLFVLGESSGNPNTEVWGIGLTARGFLYL
jgi:hypothetical protein